MEKKHNPLVIAGAMRYDADWPEERAELRSTILFLSHELRAQLLASCIVRGLVEVDVISRSIAAVKAWWTKKPIRLVWVETLTKSNRIHWALLTDLSSWIEDGGFSQSEIDALSNIIAIVTGEHRRALEEAAS